MTLYKAYKVQQTVTLKIESEIVASSKTEAKRLMDEGAGDFDESLATTHSTFKVLYEIN